MSFRTPPRSTYRHITRRRSRMLPLALSVFLVASLIAMVPAFAKGGNGGGPKATSGSTTTESTTTTTTVAETTTTTTTVAETTTTTTVAPDGSTDTAGWNDASHITDYSHGQFSGSLYWITNKVTGASEFWRAGYTGEGVDIALIDSGVVPVDGLRYPGKVINGPDLSFESQADHLRHLDTFGHGTHLAGIMAGRSDGATEIRHNDSANFVGMAPGSRIVNVKVADAFGSTDVSQVIAAIDWVVEHRTDNGMNIRVINLAYGTTGTQDHRIDPLAAAVERAWRAGIVVVVAAGNDGNAVPLRNPASDPYVIAVGSVNTDGTQVLGVSSYSNCGTWDRTIDLVAPGRSIVSLRNPGSHADQEHPEAVVADTYMLGSGTSQASAVVAGAAALLIDKFPDASPDEVKAMLTTRSAVWLDGIDQRCQGAGALDLRNASTLTDNGGGSAQSHDPALGGGSLEAARGTNHVYADGVALTGEQDIMTMPWNHTCTETTTGRGKDRTTSITCPSLWNEGDFNGATWSGASWSGASWSGASWSGASWSGASWSGASWSSFTWTGASWSGASWSGASWSGGSWSGASWSGGSWSNNTWLGLSWN